jgi:methyltransferase
MSTVLLVYLCMLVVVALQRRRQLQVAHENADLMRILGAEEVTPDYSSLLSRLHQALLVSCAVEAIWRGESPSLWVMALGLSGLGLAQWLRSASMRALGPRWTLRIVVMPKLPRVTSGVYRWIRHPDSLGVSLEVVALPLIFGGSFTAIGFGVVTMGLLWLVRIPAEEAALIRLNHDSGYRDGQGDFASH